MNKFHKQNGLWHIATNETYNRGDNAQIETRKGARSVTIGNLVEENGNRRLYTLLDKDGNESKALTTREKQKRRLQRAEKRVESNEKKAQHHYEESNRDAAFLSMGEPIKVGHHSEGRHRRAIQRANDQMGKSVGHMKKAEDAGHKAKNLRRAMDEAIYDDDPDAIEALQKRVAANDALRQQWKKENKEARGKGLDAPHMRYQFSNMSQRIKNDRDRIARLQRKAGVENE